jgi:uncharacterized membrane protein
VSGLGLLAGAAGAVLIGLAAWGFIQIWPLRGVPPGATPLLAAALLGGLGGTLFDSLLGATVQQVYWCPHCGKETERRVHSCGTPTRPLRGRPWADNEIVNLGCALAGAGLGLLVALLWRG